MTPEDAWAVLNDAELVADAQSVRSAIERISNKLTDRYRDRHPLLLVVMNGGVFFAGQLIPLLRFPLEMDYVHATRYGNETAGGKITWKVPPGHSVSGRVVVVLDDVLDEGRTLAAIKSQVLKEGAQECALAVLTEKLTGKAKPVAADFVGLELPNRYVFGCGLDVSGAWRNLPEIYAVRGM